MQSYDDGEFDDELPTHPNVLPRACVLVVEDDDSLRDLIASRMRREAFDVIEAGSGHEAMDVLAAFAANDATDAIDLLVMDLRMPGPSGLEIARLLRAAAWRTPIVLITAFPEQEVTSAASRLNLALLPKPFGLDRLSETAIEAMLAAVPAQEM
jgi:DNA-binding response OmpR family regulator